VVLDNHQSWLGDFDDAAMPRQRPGSAPHQGGLSRRHAEVYARTFDGRPDADQARRLELDRLFEDDRVRALVRRHKSDRHAWPVVFLAPEAGPECGVERGGDVGFGWERGEIALAARPRLLEMVREMGANDRRDPAGGDVREFSQT